jgi:hypothetical protein
MIVWTLQGSSGKEISKALTHFSFMNEAKVEEIEEKLSRAIRDYIDVRKLYENELRTSHVYRERVVELEAKVQALEDEIASLKEQLAQVEQRTASTQMEEEQGTSLPSRDVAEAQIQTEETGEEQSSQPRRMSIDTGSVPQGDDLRIGILKSMMSHRVDTLKNLSQQAHSSFVSLQGAEQVCNEALSWLTPTFNLWGPYLQFFDRLIMLMAKKPDLPDKIFTVKESLELVKELSGFFSGKLQVIQGRLKTLSDGIEPCIPTILDTADVVKDWHGWSTSFDDILTRESTSAIFEDTSDSPFHSLIDSLFKAEINLNKFIIESKTVMDARWNKAVQDLQTAKDTDWPTKREIYIWEAVGEIKALLTGSS